MKIAIPAGVTNQYGELMMAEQLAPAWWPPLVRAARDLAEGAATAGIIPEAYDMIAFARRGRASGSALHHEIYDLRPGRGKTLDILLCLRYAKGSKYGVQTVQKIYKIVSRRRGKFAVQDASLAIAARAAKSANYLGEAIAILRGEARLRGKSQPKRRGYKFLARTTAGELISAYDGSPWPLGELRIQRATDNHRGGFYYYQSEAEAKAAAAKNDVFGRHRDHQGLVLAEVEVSGKEYDGGGAKRCVTRMRPLKIIES